MILVKLPLDKGHYISVAYFATPFNKPILIPPHIISVVLYFLGFQSEIKLYTSIITSIQILAEDLIIKVNKKLCKI